MDGWMDGWMKFATALLMCSTYGRSSPRGLEGGFQLVGRFRLWLEFMVFCQHDTPDTIILMQ